MEKWLCFGSIGVAAALLILFLVDLIIGYPFGQLLFADIVGILACGLTGYLAWESYRESR